MTNVKANWVASPITGREMVIQEFNENYGVCSMDLSSGYYTNELNHNYKKNGFFVFFPFFTPHLPKLGGGVGHFWNQDP